MTPGKGHGEKLTRKQEQAVAALLEHSTVRQAAAAAGVSERTLRLWLKDSGFQAAYATARRQLLTHAVGRLQAATGKAVTALVRRLRSARDGDVIRAATAPPTSPRPSPPEGFAAPSQPPMCAFRYGAHAGKRIDGPAVPSSYLRRTYSRRSTPDHIRACVKDVLTRRGEPLSPGAEKHEATYLRRKATGPRRPALTFDELERQLVGVLKEGQARSDIRGEALVELWKVLTRAAGVETGGPTVARKAVRRRDDG